MNTAWLLFHTLQICIFQFYAAGKLSNLNFCLLRNRNREIAEGILPDGGQLHSKYLDYAIGIVSLLLLYIGFFEKSKALYWGGKYLSLFGFLFTALVIDLIKQTQLSKKIPLKDKRSATLVSREIGRIIPLWSWLVYIIVCIGALVYKSEIKSIIVDAISIVVILAVAYHVEKRSTLPISTKEDELYRRSESWTVFVIAWSFPIVGTLKPYLELKLYGYDAIFSTIPLVCFCFFLNSSIYKKLIA